MHSLLSSLRIKRARLFLSTLLVTATIGGAATGCVVYRGRVSTATYEEIRSGSTFIVMPASRQTLTEKNIQRLISHEMQSLGFAPAVTRESAQLVVSYSHSIGDGKTVVSSSTNSASGKTRVSSSTHYPRYFEIEISRKTPNAERRVLWQGELYSQGSSANMSFLAERFVPLIFDNFSRDVMNKMFFKPEFGR